jgi:hypothetical protein
MPPRQDVLLAKHGFHESKKLAGAVRYAKHHLAVCSFDKELYLHRTKVDVRSSSGGLQA